MATLAIICSGRTPETLRRERERKEKGEGKWEIFMKVLGSKPHKVRIVIPNWYFRISYCPSRSVVVVGVMGSFQCFNGLLSIEKKRKVKAF